MVRLLAPCGSNAFGITSFLLSTYVIHRRITGAELEFVEGNTGSDVSRKQKLSGCGFEICCTCDG